MDNSSLHSQNPTCFICFFAPCSSFLWASGPAANLATRTMLCSETKDPCTGAICSPAVSNSFVSAAQALPDGWVYLAECRTLDIWHYSQNSVCSPQWHPSPTAKPWKNSPVRKLGSMCLQIQRIGCRVGLLRDKRAWSQDKCHCGNSKGQYTWAMPSRAPCQKQNAALKTVGVWLLVRSQSPISAHTKPLSQWTSKESPQHPFIHDDNLPMETHMTFLVFRCSAFNPDSC